MTLPASVRVFQTVELLENVLSLLPYDDLRHVSSVSKDWSDVVRGSIKLQRQLFLTPDPTPLGRPIYIRARGDGHSLDGYSRYPAFKPPAEGDADYHHKTSHVAVPIMQGHPTLTLNDSWDTIEHRDHFWLTFSRKLEEVLSWPVGGAWEQELLTQPPCTSLRLYLEDGYLNIGQVNDETGVRMGAVIDRVRKCLYPRYLPRAAKTPRPKIDLKRYRGIAMRVDGCVLPDSCTVEEALRLEEEERRVREWRAKYPPPLKSEKYPSWYKEWMDDSDFSDDSDDSYDSEE